MTKRMIYVGTLWIYYCLSQSCKSSSRAGVKRVEFLWVIGTFLFAAFLNWTVNARSLLPLTPAVAILMTRRLEQNYP